MDSLLYAVPVAGIIALIYAFISSVQVSKESPGTEKMEKIGKYIADGAMAFLKAEYKVIAIFVVVVAVALGFQGAGSENSHGLVALSFLIGAICSALAGYIGMKVATKANTRTTNAARESLNKALGIAFKGGSVMGMGVVGLGVIGLSVLF
ncbi:MAG: sodium/proton-translocating pyrophosphatase, partial [Chlorobi bacterium]|nr:sodium/proton-translocating pyrophosphatase [Chlorobiota bacterium]